MENNQDPNQVQYQPNYQQPVYPQPMRDDTPLGIGNYIVMMIVGAIPLVGLIMMFVWGFSGSSNTNRKNYARAMLIMTAIGLVLSIIFGASIMAAVGSMVSNGYRY